ncbi:MAG: hypothetical protein ABI430_04805 [Candidatus Taylorbacteria bacterium]
MHNTDRSFLSIHLRNQIACFFDDVHVTSCGFLELDVPWSDWKAIEELLGLYQDPETVQQIMSGQKNLTALCEFIEKMIPALSIECLR